MIRKLSNSETNHSACIPVASVFFLYVNTVQGFLVFLYKVHLSQNIIQIVLSIVVDKCIEGRSWEYYL